MDFAPRTPTLTVASAAPMARRNSLLLYALGAPPAVSLIQSARRPSQTSASASDPQTFGPNRRSGLTAPACEGSNKGKISEQQMAIMPLGKKLAPHKASSLSQWHELATRVRPSCAFSPPGAALWPPLTARPGT